MSFLTGEKATEPRTSRRTEWLDTKLFPVHWSVWTQQQPTKHGGQGLGSIEKLGGSNGIALVGINGHVDKGLLEGVDDGGALGDGKSRHDELFVCVSFPFGILLDGRGK